MPELHETLMGRKLIEHTLPDIARQLERIADALTTPKQTKEMMASLESLSAHYTNDQDLGKAIRKLCQ